MYGCKTAVLSMFGSGLITLKNILSSDKTKNYSIRQNGNPASNIKSFFNNTRTNMLRKFKEIYRPHTSA